MKLNKKVTLGASALVAGAALIGGTMAWLTDTDELINKFSTRSWNLEIKVEEKFDAAKAKDLLPGTTVMKEGFVTNTQEVPVLVRVKIDELWGSGRDRSGNLVDTDKEITIGDEAKTLTEWAKSKNVLFLDDSEENTYLEKSDYISSKWEKIGGYYYYKGVLDPGDSTTSNVERETDKDGNKIITSYDKDGLVLSDVTVNKELTTADHQLFGSKSFDIKLTAEGVQFENDAYLEAWEISKESPENQTDIKALVKNAIDEYQAITDVEEPTTPASAE